MTWEALWDVIRAHGLVPLALALGYLHFALRPILVDARAFLVGFLGIVRACAVKLGVDKADIEKATAEVDAVVPRIPPLPIPSPLTDLFGKN